MYFWSETLVNSKFVVSKQLFTQLLFCLHRTGFKTNSMSALISTGFGCCYGRLAEWPFGKCSQIKALQLWWRKPQAICIIHWFMWGFPQLLQEHAGTCRTWETVTNNESEIENAAGNTASEMMQSCSLDSWIKTSAVNRTALLRGFRLQDQIQLLQQMLSFSTPKNGWGCAWVSR